MLNDYIPTTGKAFLTEVHAVDCRNCEFHGTAHPLGEVPVPLSGVPIAMVRGHATPVPMVGCKRCDRLVDAPLMGLMYEVEEEHRDSVLYFRRVNYN